MSGLQVAKTSYVIIEDKGNEVFSLGLIEDINILMNKLLVFQCFNMDFYIILVSFEDSIVLFCII